MSDHLTPRFTLGMPVVSKKNKTVVMLVREVLMMPEEKYVCIFVCNSGKLINTTFEVHELECLPTG
tara:strand:- start:433 stop:630 length:198 start_codon:yes stop_codon:yes gene_type:complete